MSLPCEEPIFPCAKDAAIQSMCDCPEKYIKFTKWSCVLMFCSEFPGLFVNGAEMNGDKDMDLPFICVHEYKKISSCTLHKHILTDNGKTYPPSMNIEHFEKGNIKTRNILLLESFRTLDFYSDY